MERPRIVARTGTDDMPVDYAQPSRPMRPPTAEAVKKANVPAGEPQIDYLDIPAFLRRQAD
jgi:cell division protein FtsZ